MEIQILDIGRAPELMKSAARWFSEKWGVPEAEYLTSMEKSIEGDLPVPTWYVVLRAGDSAPDRYGESCGAESGTAGSEEIIAGAGIIENDFHERTDLTPNLCALYVEEEYRCRGIAGDLLARACEDMAAAGIDTVYLVTEHDSFYERYGWKFIGMVKEDVGDPEEDQEYIRMYSRESAPADL